MKDNNTLLQVIIIAMIAVISILVTYLIVDMKTKSISEEVANKILLMEYDKVWGKENYEKLNKIQKEQIRKGLEQYDAQAGWTQAPTPQANTAPTPSPSWSTLSLEQAKKITGEDTYVLWNPDAEITWVEYSDLECPFCKKMHNAGTIGEIMEAYDGKVNFVFKQFPLNFHPNAPKESEAVLCAGELGWKDKYYEYIKTIFQRTTSNGRGFSLEALVPLAKELWIDEQDFKSCLDSGKYAQRTQQEMSEWQSIFGITGTPGNVLINNKTGKWDKLPWAYPTSSFKVKIDALLQ